MLKDYFKISINNLIHRKLRSWLTIIGILIGIAAVTALISINAGMNQAIEREFEKVGSDKITIMPGAGGIQFGPGMSGAGELTEEDLEAVRGVRGVELAEPTLYETAKVEVHTQEAYVTVMGAHPEMMDFFGEYEVEEGRPIRDNDEYKAILGNQIATSTLDEPINLRNKILINEYDFRVVGILESIGNPQDDNSVMIPLHTARELFNEPEAISAIMVDSIDSFDVNEVADDIEDELEDVRGVKDFSVTTLEQVQETVSGIIGLVGAILLGVAAISLLVGGVGIMNTMYTSVLERTKEIGILKAIGAKNSHILILFLIESGLLGLIGGVAGAVVGIGMAKAVAYFASGMAIPIEAAVTPELVVGALLFSFIVGSLSGILPARKASKLEPVDALHYE